MVEYPTDPGANVSAAPIPELGTAPPSVPTAGASDMTSFPTGGELVDVGAVGPAGLAGLKGAADGVTATGAGATGVTGSGAPKTPVDA